MNTHVGCIGGGRITRILLDGWKKAGKLPQSVQVSDANEKTLSELQRRFPDISIFPGDNTAPASNDLVFVAVHPPAMKEVLAELSPHLKSDAILVSLVPKFSIAAISELLGGFSRIVRMIPNAPSIVGAGYNPAVFSTTISEQEKTSLLDIFRVLGACPEVEEHTLEAYAILTAMGPTYLWFQLDQLQQLGVTFGLPEQDVKAGIAAMVNGAVQTMYGDGLPPEDVMDLVPVKPLKEDEETIRNMYQSKLTALFQKLAG